MVQKSNCVIFHGKSRWSVEKSVDFWRPTKKSEGRFSSTDRKHYYFLAIFNPWWLETLEKCLHRKRKCKQKQVFNGKSCGMMSLFQKYKLTYCVSPEVLTSWFLSPGVVWSVAQFILQPLRNKKTRVWQYSV